MKALATVILVTIATLLTGCLSGREFVSVEEKFSKGQTATGFHRVEKGETLFQLHGVTESITGSWQVLTQ